MLAKGQAATDDKGGYIGTPHITVIEFENGVTIEAGKFYRRGNNDIFLGIQIKTGQNGPAILYPVDRSKIPSGWTLTITNKQEEEDNAQHKLSL